MIRGKRTAVSAGAVMRQSLQEWPGKVKRVSVISVSFLTLGGSNPREGSQWPDRGLTEGPGGLRGTFGALGGSNPPRPLFLNGYDNGYRVEVHG